MKILNYEIWLDTAKNRTRPTPENWNSARRVNLIFFSLIVWGLEVAWVKPVLNFFALVLTLGVLMIMGRIIWEVITVCPVVNC